jgi:pimeloyl-ACP methyl ester carboxylesterase
MSIGMALRPRGATAAVLLQRLRQPLLVLWGEADRLVPIEVAGELRKLRPDLELEQLEGVGHCPHDEDPATVDRLLQAWLRRLPIRAEDHGWAPARTP